MDVISCVQQHMAICSCQGRQRQHTDLAVSPSPDLVSGISYLRLCVYHRHLDSFKANWRQYFFARPTRHDSARSWLLRLLELRLTNFPTYLLSYLLIGTHMLWLSGDLEWPSIISWITINIYKFNIFESGCSRSDVCCHVHIIFISKRGGLWLGQRASLPIRPQTNTANLLLRAAGVAAPAFRQLNGTSAQWCVGTFSKRHRRGTDRRTDRHRNVTRKRPPRGGPLTNGTGNT